MTDPFRSLSGQSAQPGLLARFVGFLLGIALLVLGVMFSAVILVVAVIAALAFWGWLRWKTRHLRRAATETGARTAYTTGEVVIEGEAVRVVDEEKTRPHP